MIRLYVIVMLAEKNDQWSGVNKIKKPLLVGSGFSKNEDLKMSFFRIGLCFLRIGFVGFFRNIGLVFLDRILVISSDWIYQK